MLFGLGPPTVPQLITPKMSPLGFPGDTLLTACHVAAHVPKEGGLKKVHTPIRRSLGTKPLLPVPAGNSNRENGARGGAAHARCGGRPPHEPPRFRRASDGLEPAHEATQINRKTKSTQGGPHVRTEG